MLITKSISLAACLMFYASALFADIDEPSDAHEEGRLADLVVLQLKHHTDFDTGTTDIIGTIANQGWSIKTRNPLFIQILTGTSFNTATELDIEQTRMLQADESFTLKKRIDNSRLNGNIYAIVDPANLIEEINEGNNFALSFPSTDVDLGPEAGEPDKGESAAVIDLSLETDKDSVTAGELVRFILTVRSGSNEFGPLYAVFQVLDPAADEVFRSGQLPLLLNEVEGRYHTEFYWSTLGLPDGHYTVKVSLFVDEGEAIKSISRQMTVMSLDANRPPVAKDDRAQTGMSQSVDIDLMVNDFDPDGNRLEHYITEQPRHGEVSELRGLASYTPDPGFVGKDSFSYQLDDTLGGSAWARVDIDVVPPENGCTWVRDYSVKANSGKIEDTAWAAFNLPDSDDIEFASWIRSSDNPELFERQPLISFPSCSLYFKTKAGASGSAKITYVVLDKASGGKNYVSEPRHFTLSVTPRTPGPQFISTPDTMISVGKPYRYRPLLSDDSEAEIYLMAAPDFLEWRDGTVTGVAGVEDIGLHEIWLKLEENGQSSQQKYWLSVTPKLAAGMEPQSAESVKSVQPVNSAATGSGGGLLDLSSWLLLLLPLCQRKLT